MAEPDPTRATPLPDAELPSLWPLREAVRVFTDVLGGVPAFVSVVPGEITNGDEDTTYVLLILTDHTLTDEELRIVPHSLRVGDIGKNLVVVPLIYQSLDPDTSAEEAA